MAEYSVCIRGSVTIFNSRYLEESNNICAEFFDYRKAFDTVLHRNVLSKLESFVLTPMYTQMVDPLSL